MTRTILATMLLLSLFVIGTAQNNKRQVTKAKGDTTFSIEKTVYGKVAAIEEAKVVIENPYGAKREIKMDAKTKFKNGKNKDFKLTEVTTGMMVKVTFREVDLTATVVQENVKPENMKK